MLPEINKHLAHYFSLAGIVLVSMWGIFSFPYDQGFQSVIAMSLGVAFVFWGLVHHHIHQDLHPKIVLEYVATAVLGVIILLSIIWKV